MARLLWPVIAAISFSEHSASASRAAAVYLSPWNDSPTRPTNPYAQSKDDLRREVEKRQGSAWVRFFYQFGPWEDERRFVPTVIRSLLRGEEVKVSPGGQGRDYLHVEDVASAVCSVAESALVGCVNIGSGEAPLVKDLVSGLGELTGRPELIRLGAVPYWQGEPMLIVADNAKLRSTGWTRRYDLDSALRHTVDWWRRQREAGRDASISS